MGLKTLDVIVLVLYFVIIAVIGFIATRLVRNREDFLMGGRRFGKAMMIMFSFGAGTHADSAVGVAAQSYKVGFAGIWYQWIQIFTLPIYWLLAPVFRRARVLTTADFFQRRYGTEVMYVYAIFGLYANLAYNSVMLYGAGRLIEALTGHALSWQWAMVAMAVVSFVYAIAGGLIAAVWNDFFQGMLTIVMSLLIIPFFWNTIGGLEGFQAALTGSGHPNASHIFDLVLGKDMTIYWIVMMTIASLLSMIAQPQSMASTASAKTEMDCRVGFVGGMLLKRVMTVPWALTGVMGIALLGATGTHPDHVFGEMSARLLPVGFVGLMLACVMASVMDNCAVNMLSFAGIYTNTIHNRLISPTTNERKLVLVNRVSSIGFAIVSLGLAFAFDDVTGALRFLFQTVPPMGIPFAFAILWRRANRWGALASFIAALAAVIVANYYFGWKGDTGLPKTITLYLTAGVTAGFVVSLLTSPESDERVDQFFLALKTPVGQEHVLREAGFREDGGTDTFDAPVDQRESARGFDIVTAPASPGSATAGASMPAMLVLPTNAQSLAKIDNRQARRESIMGFFVMVVVLLIMLGSVLMLAKWLSP